MTQQEFQQRYTYNPDADRIGKGGFGCVYKAYDTVRKRHVAIKASQVDEHKFDLKREVELSHEIAPHENVSTYENCYRFNIAHGITFDYAVMKYYPEGSLSEVIKSRTLNEKEKRELITGILQGIAHLHNEDVIHRDLKSGNILVKHENGHWIPRITDFGLSRIAETDSSISNSSIGISYAFAAPEQIKGLKLRKNVDLWAAGTVIYHILTGKLPFTADGITDTNAANLEISRKITNRILPDDFQYLPQGYKAIIERCWVIDMDQRAQKAEEIIKLLQEVGAEETVKEEWINHIQEVGTANTNDHRLKICPNRHGYDSKLTECPYCKEKEVVDRIEECTMMSGNFTIGKGTDCNIILHDGIVDPIKSQIECGYNRLFRCGYCVNNVYINADSDILLGRNYSIKGKELIKVCDKVIDNKLISMGQKPENINVCMQCDYLVESYIDDERCANSPFCSSNSEEELTTVENTNSIEKDHIMVYVQGGSFAMGNTDGSRSAYKDEKPVHKVTVSDYYISKYPVTQKQWMTIMGNNPSGFTGDDLPVENVSWNDIQEFIQKLNRITGKNYRLPTEAEWEFASRGGTGSPKFKYSGSNAIDNVAWHAGNSENKTHPIGTKQANKLGIYDMSGNVWEWCGDWYGAYSYREQTNPIGQATGSHRILRGGSWSSKNALECRVSYRGFQTPDCRGSNFGFRLACNSKLSS